ncbi:hypothetical protein Tco_0708261 [Tanacetum coccineum]
MKVLILWLKGIEYLRLLGAQILYTVLPTLAQLKSQRRKILLQFQVWYIWFTSSVIELLFLTQVLKLNASPSVADSDVSKPARGKEKSYAGKTKCPQPRRNNPTLYYGFVVHFFRQMGGSDTLRTFVLHYLNFQGEAGVRRIIQSVRRYVADPDNAYPK